MKEISIAVCVMQFVTLLLGIVTINTANANSMEDAFERIMSSNFKPNEPGAAVIVVRDGNVLFRKAYGMADIEQKIALKPESVFRLGSMTKQFTAVAIMLLSDEGRLTVTDDITKYLPNYPTHGKTITIENLLTHTSGIKNYTDVPAFSEHVTEDMQVAKLINYFENEPLDFDPNTRFSYSNSGYILLGAIIEKVSGKSYADFMAQHIFEPLGMKHTAYEGYERDGNKRVEGYNRDRKSGPISMTQPYAAGSLVSTIDDLTIWESAIEAGELLKPETWQKVFTPHKLANGEATNYAYGWMVGNIEECETVEHGGAIPGFSSYVIRVPKNKIMVAVLTNNDRFNILSLLAGLFKKNDPGSLAAKLAVIALE